MGSGYVLAQVGVQFLGATREGGANGISGFSPLSARHGVLRTPPASDYLGVRAPTYGEGLGRPVQFLSAHKSTVRAGYLARCSGSRM